MARPANPKKKYVSVRSNVKLYELGGIQGPIIQPMWMDINFIKMLLVNGRIVYEHSITNNAERVRLNLENYNDFNIYPENSAIEDPTINPNVYYVTIMDYEDEKTMTAGGLYVRIVDDVDG